MQNNINIDLIFMKRTLIDKARNELAKDAISGNYDYLLFLDDDNFFEKRTDISELLNSGKDIISGLIRGRVDKKLCIFKDADDLKYENIEDNEFEAGELIQIGACGTGCLLIKVEVLRKLNEEYQRIFQNGLQSIFLSNGNYLQYNQIKGHTIDNIYTREIGEDILFCERARNLGYDIYCNTKVKLIHLGQEEHIKV